jgi:hypothetical protein
MLSISFNDGVTAALSSLLNDRLALLVGAGLSMAPPSNLPSAATIAGSVKQRYGAMYGSTRPPLADDVQDQAEFFFQRDELATVFLRTLIDQHTFAGNPNPGHYAAADLLLVKAIQTGVTTNVDTLIEMAGQMLFGQVGVGIDGPGVATLPVDVAPLLKIHGCRMCDRDHMVWAPGQLTTAPIAGRIASSAAWLTTRLFDRDLLIVGYWTDWDYLNNVLATVLAGVNAARVTVVDTANGSTFPTKAPALYALGQRAAAFGHVQASGADFLDALRREFSKSFIRRVLWAAENDYLVQVGAPPAPAWLEPSVWDNSALWQIRRDLEGCAPNEPAKQRNPPNESLLGLTILQLEAAGAVADGPYWLLLDGRRVRVLRAVNKFLHRVEAEYQRELAPTVAPNLVIAVGAEALGLPLSIVRSTTVATIARGSASRWLTRPQALDELSL